MHALENVQLQSNLVLSASRAAKTNHTNILFITAHRSNSRLKMLKALKMKLAKQLFSFIIKISVLPNAAAPPSLAFK